MILWLEYSAIALGTLLYMATAVALLFSYPPYGWLLSLIMLALGYGFEYAYLSGAFK